MFDPDLGAWTCRRPPLGHNSISHNRLGYQSAGSKHYTNGLWLPCKQNHDVVSIIIHACGLLCSGLITHRIRSWPELSTRQSRPQLSLLLTPSVSPLRLKPQSNYSESSPMCRGQITSSCTPNYSISVHLHRHFPST